MISNDLIEEVLYLSSKGKILDKKIILKIVSKLLSSLDDNTASKFNGVLFSDKKHIDKKSYAGFNKRDGKIILYLDEINRRNFKTILDKNLIILESLMHEFKHLEEEYKLSKQDFESLIIAASNNEVIYDSLFHKNGLNIDKVLPNRIKELLFIKYYFKIYNLIPTESIADIEANSNLLKSLDKYPKFSKAHTFEYDSLKERLFDSYFMGYKYSSDGYNIPLVDYFRIVDNVDTLKIFNFYGDSKLNFMNKARKIFKLEDRFKYGLPIDDEDKKQLSKKIILH